MSRHPTRPGSLPPRAALIGVTGSESDSVSVGGIGSSRMSGTRGRADAILGRASRHSAAPSVRLAARSSARPSVRSIKQDMTPASNDYFGAGTSSAPIVGVGGDGPSS